MKKRELFIHTRSESMTRFDIERIRKFRDRLYQKHVADVVKKGSHGLKPIQRYRHDDQGRLVVSTKEIADFFSRHVQPEHVVDAEEYVETLYLLFKVFGQEAEEYSFEGYFSVSEGAIQEADNKTTIEFLTKNLINTYFSNLKTPAGGVNSSLLTKDLSHIIALSGEGRDYRTLVSNMLEKLIRTLTQEKSWRECFDYINDASLVCRLVGAKLPKIDPNVLDEIVLDARKDISGHVITLSKILNTQDRAAAGTLDRQMHSDLSGKLDTALHAVLQKIDIHLSCAWRFMKIIGRTPETFFGKADSKLRDALARAFFGFQQDRNTEYFRQADYSIMRYHITRLFEFENIAAYCRGFQYEEEFSEYYFRVFRLYFSQLIKKLDELVCSETTDGLGNLKNSLTEMKKAVQTLALEENELEAEKKSVQEKYVEMICRTNPEKLPDVMDIKANVEKVTFKGYENFPDRIREALLETCFAVIKSNPEGTVKADVLQSKIQKQLYIFSVYYKPQRYFYQNFFEKYVGQKEAQTPSKHLADLYKSNRYIAFALLSVFSDPIHVSQLLPADQIDYSKQLLKKLLAKESSKA